MLKAIEEMIRAFIVGTDETFYRAQRRWHI